MRFQLRPTAVALALLLVFGACTSSSSSDDNAASDEQPSQSTSVEAPATEGNTIPVAVDPAPDTTPIPLDPSVTTGELPNGLTYFIVENQAPGLRAEMRLVVNAGSAQQVVADSGNAHFLEHMLFNGTSKYPGNELDDVLRSLGMEIGPDINAYTSFDETVYELSLPKADAASIEQGFDVVAEWAGSALIDPAEVVAERGVVREELRLRSESAEGVLNQRFTEVYTANSGYEGHDPIGTEERIMATEAGELRQFYDDWYRPDNMSVVVVGDFKASDVEAQLAAALGGLSDRGAHPERTATIAEPLTDPVIEVLTHPDGPEPSISLDFELPNWEPGTTGGERLLLGDEVIALMLQNYLNEAAAAGTVDLVRPFVGTFVLARERRFLGMNVTSDDLATAASDLLRAVQSAKLTGFSDDQFGAAKQQLQAGIDQIKSGAASKQDGEFADGLAAYFLAGHAFEDSDVWYERLNGELASFSLDEINNLFRWEMAYAVPLLVAIGSDAGDLPTEAELQASVDAALTANAIDQADVESIDQLLERPASVEPVDSGVVPGSDGATWWAFDNGTTVIHENSTISTGSVMVWAIGEGGRVLLSPEDAAVADVALNTVANSGLGEYGDVVVSRYLADRSASLTPFLSTESEGFTGQAESSDIATVFELLTMYITEPRADAIGFAEAESAVKAQLREIETNPRYASLLAGLDARFGADPRYIGVPNLGQVEAMTPDDALRIYTERFGAVDDLVVIVVGDVTASTIEELAASYAGTLPTRVDGAIPEMPPLPVGPIERSVGAGTNGSGAGIDLTYSIAGGLDRKEQVAGDYLTSIINGRLFDRVREELGASYGGGSANISTGRLADGETSLSVSVDGDPDRLDEIRAVVAAELSSLATKGPETGDFADAASIVRSDADLVSNFDLLLSLSEWALDQSKPVYTRSQYAADAARVTNAEVQALAAKLIDDTNLVAVTREQY